MRKFKLFFTFISAMFIFISGLAQGQTEKSNKKAIFEAEDMNLSRYETHDDGSSIYIKLTDSTGIAKFNFDLPSGNYDIDVRYLSESIGQNTYTMYIAQNQIVAWLGKNKDDQWHMLSEQQWHIPKEIEINIGDEIRIEALSETGSLVIFDYLEFTQNTQSSSPMKENLVTVYPEEYVHAIKNPLKGFRPSSKDNHEYGTLSKSYIKWNELENNVNDGIDKIKKFCNEKWRGIEKSNKKVIPRVYIEWPGQEGGWPADMTEGDYTSNQFKKRVTNLIKKLGEVWDNDPRVAFVEMGLVGEWGEMEWPDTKNEIKSAIAAQFATSFQKKIVMIRWPHTFNDDIYNFGYYWDSFAHKDQEYYAFHLNKTSPRWRTAVIGGETAYNWGNIQIQPGKSPEESLRNPVHRDFLIDKIRTLHANHLGWIANYDHSDKNVRSGAEMVQKVFGYRFVLSEVTYPKRIDTNNQFTVSFKVKNTGSSPFYYNWPLEVSLIDAKTKQVVWKKQCADLDIRDWMPGDKWDESNDLYRVPAEDYLVNQTFMLSEDIPSGEYILAFAILDPAGNRPCARFAINNYYNGGRHPIGKVGINQEIETFSISEFDDIQSDKSLSYDLVIE